MIPIIPGQVLPKEPNLQQHRSFEANGNKLASFGSESTLSPTGIAALKKELIVVEKTRSGIYFLHPYYPKDMLDSLPQDVADITRRIWKFKDGNSGEVESFAREIAEALIPIAENSNSKKFALAAIPSSKAGKDPPMRKAISLIARWSAEGHLKTKYGFEKPFLDYGDLLRRTSDVDTAHLQKGNRPTKETHKESITCTKDNISHLWVNIVLLDEVTTTGTIMDVCRDILVEHGAKEWYLMSCNTLRAFREFLITRY